MFEVDIKIDLMWQTSYFFSDTKQPNWSGFMQTYRNGDYPGKSDVNLLPIINLNPSDKTCIYSTLLYVIDLCKKSSCVTPCITFDQPLWLKSIEIISEKSLKIVCRLGGFHAMMSFLGSIGTVMKGSGLSECLQTIYGENAVTHIETGKAIARAIRLTENAAYYHCLRVHLQVIEWKTLMNTRLPPTYWGWKIVEGCFEPIMTDLEPAPPNILKFIRCKCNVASKNTCGSNICTSRKNGLKCVAACGSCNGVNCENSNNEIDQDDDDGEDDYRNIFEQLDEF